MLLILEDICKQPEPHWFWQKTTAPTQPHHQMPPGCCRGASCMGPTTCSPDGCRDWWIGPCSIQPISQLATKLLQIKCPTALVSSVSVLLFLLKAWLQSDGRDKHWELVFQSKQLKIIPSATFWFLHLIVHLLLPEVWRHLHKNRKSVTFLTILFSTRSNSMMHMTTVFSALTINAKNTSCSQLNFKLNAYGFHMTVTNFLK